MKRLFLFVLLLPCLFFDSSGQGSNTSESEALFSKTFSKQDYLADLNALANTLIQTHPTPYTFTPKDEFEAIVKRNKQGITDATSYREFIWRCSEIVASLKCGHTSLGYFNQEDKILPIHLRFPLEARLIENSLYISDPLVNVDKVESGREILTINGKDIEQIRTAVFRHISSQGGNESTKRRLFNGYFTAYIPFELGFPDTYVIQVKGKTEPIRIELDPLSNYQYKPRIHPENDCQKNLCLNFLEDEKIALISIRTFAYYGDKYPLYKQFIDESFQEIREKKVKKLILDLRMNGGGPSDAGIYLLRHLSKAPFTYFEHAHFDEKKDPIDPLDSGFEGEVYALIDGDGGSTTGHVISLVKHLKLATLIGEELGSNHYCTGGQKRFQLPHTKISYSVGRYTYITSANSFPLDRGIIPDHAVIQPIEDFLKNKDTVMEYTLNLMRRK